MSLKMHAQWGNVKSTIYSEFVSMEHFSYQSIDLSSDGCDGYRMDITLSAFSK